MTKNIYKTLLASVAAVLLFAGCDTNNADDANNSFDAGITANTTSLFTTVTSADLANQEFILSTYTTKLPDGVDSIQAITNEHPLYVKGVLKSLYVVDKDLDEANLAIYYYSNNRIALLAQNNLNNIVYTYVITADTKEFVDVFVVEKKETASSLIGSSQAIEIQLKSSVQNQILNSYNGNDSAYELQDTFGSCMKKSMKELYDAWDKDAWGSLMCWFTGPLCAAAALIHCIAN